MTIASPVFIESPSEKDHGAIYHGMNNYAAQLGIAGTGGYFFAVYDENKNIIGATKKNNLSDFTSLHLFVVSLRCDHSSLYCQVSRQNVKTSSCYDMTEEIADKAIDQKTAALQNLWNNLSITSEREKHAKK